MDKSDGQSHLPTMINQVMATGLWALVALGWGLEFLTYCIRRSGEFHEPYGFALGMMLFPFALAFQIAAIGWYRRAAWRWIAQCLPLVAIFVAKWWLFGKTL